MTIFSTYYRIFPGNQHLQKPDGLRAGLGIRPVARGRALKYRIRARAELGPRYFEARPAGFLRPAGFSKPDTSLLLGAYLQTVFFALFSLY